MIQERPIDTVRRWANEDWEKTMPTLDELTTKLQSISNETHRVPDTHYYRCEDELLIDPDTGSPILFHIAPGVEYEVALDLQTKVSHVSEGMFVWNSPKLEGVYPCNKTMVYQVVQNENNKKVLRYTAILYDGDIEDPETHRSRLISMPDSEDSLLQVLAWIDGISPDDRNEESGFSRIDARFFAQQFVDGVNANHILNEMQSYGFIGQNAISCPTGVQTFSNYASGRGNVLIYAGGKDRYGSLEFKCSRGHWNKRPAGKLLKYCKVCGEDVSCGQAA